MKKLILFAALIGFANAGMWSSIQGWTAETRKPDAFYAVDTVGENIRVYEFTPKSQPGYTCVIVFVESDKKSPPMNCFKKEK